MAEFGETSDLLNDISTFNLLHQIWKQNKGFFVNIPFTIINGLDWEDPTIVTAVNGRLEFRTLVMNT
jgi:hypothetical protein